MATAVWALSYIPAQRQMKEAMRILHSSSMPKGILLLFRTFPCICLFGDRNREEIIEDNPEVEKWFLIGHSLGGLPISQIAAKQPEKLEGIAFVASLMICDLSDTDLSAIRITAEHDGVMPDKMMESNLDYLPENSTSVMIEGANHNQFGAYWHPGFDGKATITWKEQQDQMISLILDFFDEQIHSEDIE